MNKPFRIGIVGCGGIAEHHVNRYKEAGGNEIVAVFDIFKASAEKLAAKTGARVAASIEEMIEKDQLDGVTICSPAGVHLENCKPFLEAGIAVLCEKPLEVDVAQAEKLAALVKKTGTVFMTAFCHRFHPAVLELRSLIDKGVLGEPVLFRNIFANYISMEGNHRLNAKLSGGGSLIDNGAHSLDLYRFLMGDPTEGTAMTGNVVQMLPVEDFSMILLSKDGKAFGEINAGYSLIGCGAFVEWYGTKGTAIISYGNPGCPDLKYKTDGDWIEVNCDALPDRFVAEQRHFMECARAKKTPSITAEDGLKANQIVKGLYEAAAQKKWVKF